ncbi:hypothetical protein KXD40_002534 [Peronospora effusa]|uniref:BZIP domain-containing protein n=1 Tax=Peronospora effusa TaxID=542832 RepID=A0A3M6VSM6_9STRA|nr:hypothetical protein DD238_004283 [Peronospora effusa]RQM18006.1 hypothetical protein DD237_001339 [Peronospora effusa]UIZ27167.1 hypothetical protein KXD40_002534 [Peronospora effusa]CAI5703903.1 unnamed protein product [Peronospora effusa]
MSLGYDVPIMLPPIRPSFASNESCMTLLSYENDEQRVQYEEDMARYFGVPLPSYIRQSQEEVTANLRTPTSVQLLSTRFPPFSSPVKKDSASSKTILPLLQLQLDSPTHTDGSTETDQSGEEEKLRVNRERNRLHAQRTRLRKRELLESLTERIQALQDEFQLLKQAYDFHTTAVCLLRLGHVHDVPCVLRLEQVGDNAMDDRDENGQLYESLKTTCCLHESDCDDETHEQEKDCAEMKDNDDVCTCPDEQINSNGKRPLLSTDTGSKMLGYSKEERERMRRERNRLHARRARLRKKLVLEKSQQTVHDLRERNNRLRSRLSVLVSSIYGSETCLDDPDAMS